MDHDWLKNIHSNVIEFGVHVTVSAINQDSINDNPLLIIANIFENNMTAAITYNYRFSSSGKISCINNNKYRRYVMNFTDSA